MLLLYGAAIIAIFYILFDVNYFLRVFCTIAWARFFGKKKKLLDTSTIYGICTTYDIDIVLTHMNNARYLRELDFARYYHYDRTKLYTAILKRGGVAFQTASNVRYRRAISFFRPYKITTKIIYWDNKHFYMEQRFINITDNFVYAIVLNRQTVIGQEISIQNIITDIEPDTRRPKLTKELKLWLESIQQSSQNLRKQS
ncbi:protein THEM6-like [Linepithema humile]|uniref:protein THEM6-like n=1 Tax=Linepithema humile TaxID=83485 RepID=UPI00062367BD|nr:PREDICTED: protein THEM6-like [Linepithema humile]XP_012217287.1 PREDICTED: protein THEM6-like [Linepithema humile]XP_012217288.1 PREDICTED: protein THEM6-like [Linepithema humile]XP_012217289.1 PREDICTED: protein THEM6-like [Linepithema humile]XP_012217290.1 PREDICTED: protein THEM6-like [Linepithema humile]XP_012217291.1 PREDICTED: protein THEM6-like [Linepithema humile]